MRNVEYSSRTSKCKRHPCWLASVLLLLGIAGANGQEPEPQVTIRKDVHLVLVDVLVADNKGNTLGGLRANDIVLMDENVPQEIAHFSQDRVPLAIALVVDASGSMGAMFDPVRKALIKALPALRAGDQVALFSFNYETHLRVGLTRDADQLSKAIQRLYANGTTNLTDAVYQSAQYLRKSAPQSRRIVILVSDLMATWMSRTSMSNGESEVLESDVALFVVRLPSRAEEEGRSLHAWISSLADYSGGLVITSNSRLGIQSSVELIFDILKARYTLGFYPHHPGKPGSTRRIIVRLTNDEIHRVMPGAFVRYKRQYTVPDPDTREAGGTPDKHPRKRQ